LEESRHLGLKLLNVLGTSFVSQLDVPKFIAKKGVEFKKYKFPSIPESSGPRWIPMDSHPKFESGDLDPTLSTAQVVNICGQKDVYLQFFGFVSI
jgi:hypothetical protein